MTAPTDMDRLYQQLILDHARTARGSALRTPYDAESRQVNPTCGDEITLRVQLAGDRVADLSYETLGCAISQASASVLAELATGQPVAETLDAYESFHAMLQAKGADPGDPTVLGDAVAFAGVGRYPARVKCALLPWTAYRDALAQISSSSTTGGRP